MPTNPSREMNCGYCMKTKHKDGFPNTYFAQCWQCFWEAHQRDKHPISWAQRRQIRRNAHRYVKAKLTADARSTLDAIHELDAAPEPFGVL